MIAGLDWIPFQCSLETGRPRTPASACVNIPRQEKISISSFVVDYYYYLAATPPPNIAPKWLLGTWVGRAKRFTERLTCICSSSSETTPPSKYARIVEHWVEPPAKLGSKARGDHPLDRPLGGRGRRYGMGIMSESPSVPGRVTNKQTRCALGGRLAFGPIGAWYGPFTKKCLRCQQTFFFCFVLVGRERKRERACLACVGGGYCRSMRKADSGSSYC